MSTDEEAGDPRPWEQPGAFRRDHEPHRSDWLRAGGLASLIAAMIGWLCDLASCLIVRDLGLRSEGDLTFFLATAVPLPFLAVGIGTVTMLLARRDLREIQAGRMDPAGRDSAEQGCMEAGMGTVIGGLALGVLGGILLQGVLLGPTR